MDVAAHLISIVVTSKDLFS